MAGTATGVPIGSVSFTEYFWFLLTGEIVAFALNGLVALLTVFSFSELGFQEFWTLEFVTEVLTAEGFTVEPGCAGMPTCYVGSWGSGKPVIGFMGDIDGLPETSQRPGVAYQDTILMFHTAKILEHCNAANCILEGNPLHGAQIEIVRAIGDATQRNFQGPIQTIIPWAGNLYTDTLIERVRHFLKDLELPEGEEDFAPALANLGDGDNNHMLCMDTTDRPISVSFPEGILTDPNDDLNPATTASVTPLR